MAKGRQRKGEEKEKRRTETPSILTAAGLLAFYEEEQARVKITPGVVIGGAIAFIAASLLASLLIH